MPSSRERPRSPGPSRRHRLRDSLRALLQDDTLDVQLLESDRPWPVHVNARTQPLSQQITQQTSRPGSSSTLPTLPAGLPRHRHHHRRNQQLISEPSVNDVFAAEELSNGNFQVGDSLSLPGQPSTGSSCDRESATLLGLPTPSSCIGHPAGTEEGPRDVSSTKGQCTTQSGRSNGVAANLLTHGGEPQSPAYDSPSPCVSPDMLGMMPDPDYSEIDLQTPKLVVRDSDLMPTTPADFMGYDVPETAAPQPSAATRSPDTTAATTTTAVHPRSWPSFCSSSPSQYGRRVSKRGRDDTISDPPGSLMSPRVHVDLDQRGPPAAEYEASTNAHRQKRQRPHYNIEKRYRAGINERFEALRECVESRKALQHSDVGSEPQTPQCNALDRSARKTAAYSGGDVPQRIKLNKAEVLSEAVTYIQDLKEENEVMVEYVKLLVSRQRAAKSALGAY